MGAYTLAVSKALKASEVYIQLASPAAACLAMPCLMLHVLDQQAAGEQAHTLHMSLNFVGPSRHPGGHLLITTDVAGTHALALLR